MIESFKTNTTSSVGSKLVLKFFLGALCCFWAEGATVIGQTSTPTPAPTSAESNAVRTLDATHAGGAPNLSQNQFRPIKTVTPVQFMPPGNAAPVTPAATPWVTPTPPNVVGQSQAVAPPVAAATTQDSVSAKAVEGDEVNEDELAKDATTEINVKNADIAAIIRIFSKRTKRNYILDERVKGKVSIYLPGRVSAEESIRILDSVLALKGFTAVPVSDNLWKILPSKEARQSTIPTTTEDSDHPSATMVTRLINLKFVSSEDVKQLITPLISGDGLVNSYTGTNSLILIDLEDNVSRLVNIIDSLDVPFSNREMTIIPIKFADAAELATKLNEILGTASSGSSNDNSKDSAVGAMDLIRARMRETAALSANTRAGTANEANSQSQPPGQANSQGASVGMTRSREPKITAEERTNSIIVVADEDTTTRIRALISQLDTELDLSGNKFYVYRCQHANAQELAEVLSNLAGTGGSNSSGSSGTSRSSRSDDDSFSSGSLFGSGSSRSSSGRTSTGRSQRSQDRLSSQRRTPGQSRSDSKNSGGSASVQFGDDTSITADPATNSLIIHASKSSYQKILSLLKELDIKRRQVLVEALLLEVEISDSTSMGTDFLVSAGGKDGGILAHSDFNGGLGELLKDPTKMQDFSMAAASSGTLTLPGNISIPTQSVLLEAAQSNEGINVLSAPTILATDNEQAEIVVGNNVPFISSTSSSTDNLNNTFNQVDRQDVGITLRLTPHISSGETVSLQLFTEVSDVVPSQFSDKLGPTTSIRTSETTVITRDGQMVVIGGLIADKSTETNSGVPFLKDVPVLGQIFRVGSDAKQRRNLLIFITPRVIQDQYDARDVTKDRTALMETDIESNEIHPDRRNILLNDQIDNTSEIKPYDGPKPGTIRAPEQLKDQEILGSQATLSTDRPIELKVSPRLPQFPKERGSLTRTVVPGGDQGQFIVFEVVDKSHPANTPFDIDRKTSHFGVKLPIGITSGNDSFFQVGELYSYSIEDKPLRVRPLGVFASASEANEFAPVSSRWYTLSPYELMNLGNGPWRKSKR